MTSLTTNFDAMTATHDFAHPRKHELPETYPKGRRCEHEANGKRCITRLCQFNPGPYCYTHAPLHAVEIAERDYRRETARERVLDETDSRTRYALAMRDEDFPLRYIGADLGISYERVRQLLAAFDAKVQRERDS